MDRGKRKSNEFFSEKSSRRHIDPAFNPPPRYDLPPAYDDWEDPSTYLANDSLSSTTQSAPSSSFSAPSSSFSAPSSSFTFTTYPSLSSSSMSSFQEEKRSSSSDGNFSQSSHNQSSAYSSVPSSSFAVFETIKPQSRPIPSAPFFSSLDNTNENSSQNQAYPTSFASSFPTTTFHSSTSTSNIYPTSHPKPWSSVQTGSFLGADFDDLPNKPPVRHGVRVLPTFPCGASTFTPSTPSFSPDFIDTIKKESPASHYSPLHALDLPRDACGNVQVFPAPSTTGSVSSYSKPANNLTASSPRASSRARLLRCLYHTIGGFVSLFTQVPSDRTDYEKLPSVPWIAIFMVLIFTISAISIELLPFWIVSVSCFIIWRSISPQQQTIHVFLDHSNLVCSSVHQNFIQSRKKLSYTALVRLLRRPKNILGMFSYLTPRCLRKQGFLFLAGSTPAHAMHLESHPQWEDARKAGFELRVLPRLQREYAVDDVIHKAIANTVLKAKRWLCFGYRPRDVIVIVSGDANDNEGHGGFPQQVRLALNQGLEVEVWSMSDSLGRKGYEHLLQHPRFRLFTLDPYVDELYM